MGALANDLISNRDTANFPPIPAKYDKIDPEKV